jgi:predicted O-methyltransferase YrrM
MSVRPLLEEWRALPPRVALFRLRARRLARRTGDEFSPVSAMRTDELGRLLELARGRRAMVELGTGTGWTAIALALADGERRVLSYDPIARDERRRYLDLAGPAVSARIELLELPGESGPPPGAAATELLFIDSSHERAETLAAFGAWRDRLTPGAVVAFHDYDEPLYPGVSEAVRELGLEGEVFGHLFIWDSDSGK